MRLRADSNPTISYFISVIPPLETKRLRLRRFTEGDFENLCAQDGDPQVMKFVTNGLPRSHDEIANWLKRVIAGYNETSGLGFWAAELKTNHQFVGTFGLGLLPGRAETEIGFRILVKHWDRGYATEGCRELLKYAFEHLGLDRVVAITELENLASKKVLEKSGLKYNGDIEYQASPDQPKEILSWFVATAP